MGLPVRVGRWRIPGRPRTILIEFSKLYEKKDAVLTKPVEDFRVDSIHGGWDYVEPVLFGHAAGLVIERWWEEFLASEHKRAVGERARVDDVLGAALPQEARAERRARCSRRTRRCSDARCPRTGSRPTTAWASRRPRRSRKQHNVTAKHSLESVAAREADVFTTVSEITAKEAALLLGRTPAPLTTNGLDVAVIDELAGKTTREEARHALLHTASRFFGEDVSATRRWSRSRAATSSTTRASTSCSTPWRASRSARAGASCSSCSVPAGNSGVRSEFLERRDKPLDEIEGPLGLSTHNLFDPEHDPVHEHCQRLGLTNAGDARVRVIQVPIYLSTQRRPCGTCPTRRCCARFDITCFPSYYEPWGYTPQESLARRRAHDHQRLRGLRALGQGRRPRAGERRDRAGARARALRGRARRSSPARSRATSRARRARGARGHLPRDARSARAGRSSCRATTRPSRTALECVQKRLEAGVLQTRKPKQPLSVKPAPEGKRPHLFHFDVSATLPAELRGLLRLSRNLWWSWDHEASALYEELSPRSWETCGHNPVAFLSSACIPRTSPRRPADKAYVDAARAHARALRRVPALRPSSRRSGARPRSRRKAAARAAPRRSHRTTRWPTSVPSTASTSRCASTAAASASLAGDHLKSASDLILPLVAVGLFYRMGYTTPAHRTGRRAARCSTSRTTRASCRSSSSRARAAPRSRSSCRCPGARSRCRPGACASGACTLYLLDSNRPENRPEDRDITRNLYGGDEETRILQEIVLGRGGKRLLAAARHPARRSST